MEIILKVILAGSSVGFLGLLIKKLPYLAALKKSSEGEFLIQNSIEKIKQALHPKKIEIHAITQLEKSLRQTKILSIKTENMIERWLQGLREKNHKATKVVEEKEMLKKEQDFEETRKRHQYFGNLVRSLREESKKFKSFSLKSVKLPKTTEIKESTYQHKKIIAQEPAVSPKYIKEMERRLIDMIVESPKDINAYKKLGLLYAEENEKEKAKECLEMVLKLGSKDKRIKEKLEQLSTPA